MLTIQNWSSRGRDIMMYSRSCQSRSRNTGSNSWRVPGKHSNHSKTTPSVCSTGFLLKKCRLQLRGSKFKQKNADDLTVTASVLFSQALIYYCYDRDSLYIIFIFYVYFCCCLKCIYYSTYIYFYLHSYNFCILSYFMSLMVTNHISK